VRLAKRPTNSAFVPIESLVVLLVLALSGLAVAFIIHSFATPLPWYAWPISFLLLPSAALGILLFVEHRPDRRSR